MFDCVGNCRPFNKRSPLLTVSDVVLPPFANRIEDVYTEFVCIEEAVVVVVYS